jgi:hypothetical protein
MPRYILYDFLPRFTSRPALSLVPASMLPSITAAAPTASALHTSPDERTPPSAITGTAMPESRTARTTSYTAVSCGTPVPVTRRVVQIEPGPMPTLSASGSSRSASRASAALAIALEQKLRRRVRRNVADNHLQRRVAKLALERAQQLARVVAGAVRRVDDNDARAGLHERARTLELGVATADGGGDEKVAVVVEREARHLALVVGDVAPHVHAEQLVGARIDHRQLLDEALLHDRVGLRAVDVEAVGGDDLVAALHDLAELESCDLRQSPIHRE